jgi:hypothetical protein
MWCARLTVTAIAPLVTKRCRISKLRGGIGQTWPRSLPDGARTYRLRVAAQPPCTQFWSLIAYQPGARPLNEVATMLAVAIVGLAPRRSSPEQPELPSHRRGAAAFAEFARIAGRRPAWLLPLDVGEFLHRALAGGAPLGLAHVRGGIPEAHAVGKRFATATGFARR